MRGILARKFVERLRSEEMEFLGMQRKKKTPEEERNDPIQIMERQRIDRKATQDGFAKTYETSKGVLK
jgi:hypothetical protein